MTNNKWRYCVGILFAVWLCVATYAQADCVVLDLTAWTVAQRRYLHHVIAAAVSTLPTRHSFVENTLKLCAETTIPVLDSATLQSAAQAAVDAHGTADEDREARRIAAQTEVRTNNLCTATLQEVDSRLDAIHNAIQANIDLIDPTNTAAKIRTAMTFENARRTAVAKQVARCVRGRSLLQGAD